MLKTCRSKSWLIALVATLLAVSPAFAQSTRPDPEVKVRKGGIVVKKVMKNGEVVDEDVQVFGDLDDETRRRVLELVGKCCPKSGDQSPGKKGSGKQAGGDCSLGDEVRKHIEQALREHGIGHGRHIFRLPGHGLNRGSALQRLLEGHMKQLGGGRFPGGVHIFRGGPGGSWVCPQGPGGSAPTEGRICIEIDGKTVLDKQIQPGRKAAPGPHRVRPEQQAAPRRATPRGDASSLDAIRRLERDIKRMQRELEALKRDLGKPRPIRLERGSAPVRNL